MRVDEADWKDGCAGERGPLPEAPGEVPRLLVLIGTTNDDDGTLNESENGRSRLTWGSACQRLLVRERGPEAYLGAAALRRSRAEG